MPPNQFVSSIKRVLAPFRADCIAADVPPAPPPTITTSYSDESLHETNKKKRIIITLYNFIITCSGVFYLLKNLL